jgi:disulfide bond formation protein DsbB
MFEFKFLSASTLGAMLCFARTVDTIHTTSYQMSPAVFLPENRNVGQKHVKTAFLRTTAQNEMERKEQHSTFLHSRLHVSMIQCLVLIFTHLHVLHARLADVPTAQERTNHFAAQISQVPSTNALRRIVLV